MKLKKKQKIKKWICGKLAKFLLMENPKQTQDEKNQREKDSLTKVSMDKSSMDRMMFKHKNNGINSNSSSNDINTMSSKSLMANVLNINDDYGLATGHNNSSRLYYMNKNSCDRIKSMNYQNYIRRENSNVSESNYDDSSSYKSDTNNPFKKNLYGILKEVRKLTKKIEDDEEDETKILEWRFAAMVIDRLCVVIFTVATVFSTILILFTSKNFFKLM